MDLISRKAAIEAIDHEREMLITQGRNGVERVVAHHARRLIEDMPSVPAVPLDKLCEWLEKNACYYQTEDNGGSTRFSLDSCQWKIVLAKWMEEQDADRQ